MTEVYKLENLFKCQVLSLSFILLILFTQKLPQTCSTGFLCLNVMFRAKKRKPEMEEKYMIRL